MKNKGEITYKLPSINNDIIYFEYDDIIVKTVLSTSVENHGKNNLILEDINKLELRLVNHHLSEYIATEINSEYTICITIRNILLEKTSLMDMSLIARPKLLIILGIISYISEHHYSVFDCFSTDSNVINSETINKNTTTVFKKNNKIDNSKILSNILKQLNQVDRSTSIVLFSILDKWRKGLYLDLESKDNYLYHEEAKLSYFQIIELLSGQYSSDLKNNSNELIENFITDYTKKILSICETDSDNNSLSRRLKQILNNEIHLKNKILYMLKQVSFYNDKIDDYISILISERNNIAHCRETFNEKSHWPLLPYFTNNSHEIYSIEILRYFTARLIAIFLNSNIYKETWKSFEEDCLIDENQALEYVQLNFSNSQQLNDIKYDQIINGGLNYLIILKRIKIKQCTNYFKDLLNSDFDIQYIANNIESFIVLYEHVDDINTEEKIKLILTEIQQKEKLPYFKYRDLVNYLESYGHKCVKLMKLIISEEIN